MDTRTTDQALIERILIQHTEIPYAHGNVQFQPIFDRERNHYVLMLIGRDDGRRIHGCLIHVDLVDNVFHIQRDGTERGIARELLEAGVPLDRIVLAFRWPDCQPQAAVVYQTA